MGKIYTSAEQLIGGTPLVELTRMEQQMKLCARVLVKTERSNPGGSAKDRAALEMIRDAEDRGILKPGSVIIEPTSGNTGIALAMVGSIRGYEVMIGMPDSMSMERRQLIAAYGATLVLTPGAEGMTGAIAKAEELAKQHPGSFIAGQFTNPANSQAHYKTTGPEIWADTDGNVDILVAGIGTGGTVTGIGKYLKEQKPDIQVVGVEPADSPILTGGQAGPHGIQGIGANFVPDVLDRSILDRVMDVKTEDSFEASRALGRTEGILAGISSGAALWAALELAKQPENTGKTIVAVLPDSGERYLSSGLFEC